MRQAKILFCVLFLTSQALGFSMKVPFKDEEVELTTTSIPELPSTPELPTTPELKLQEELESSLRENLTENPLVKNMRPPGKDDTTHVKVNMYVRDIQLTRKNPEETKSQELYHWVADLTLRQMWNDKRVAFDNSKAPQYKYYPLNSAKSLWVPDTFFPESVSGELHTITEPNVLLWVYPNGDVIYSIRLSVTLRCWHSANSASPNLDCPLRMASYGYEADKVDYQWEEDTPIQFRKQIYIPHYEAGNVTTESTTSSTKTGTYSTIIAKFQFKPQEE